MKVKDSDARSGEGTSIPQASLTRIRGQPSGRYARKGQGQVRRSKRWREWILSRLEDSWNGLFLVLLVGVNNLALVGVPSRRLIIQKPVLGVPDLNPPPHF